MKNLHIVHSRKNWQNMPVNLPQDSFIDDRVDYIVTVVCTVLENLESFVHGYIWKGVLDMGRGRRGIGEGGFLTHILF